LSALAEQLRCAIHDGPGHRFTLHLDFTAVDAEQARVLAAALAECLGLLRPEVDAYTAAMSRNSDWAVAQPVFSAIDDSDRRPCADIADHPV
jgi:hypothetical protein